MKQKNEIAVSPVVGVMLMLVVVIIIAAVVSGFAGGLIGSNNQKPPQLSMDVKLANGGYWSNSYLMMTVTGVDTPIPTKDLKIVTSWSKTLPDGTKIPGGNTVVPGLYNYNVYYWIHSGAMYDNWKLVAPMGYGPGVISQNGTAIMSMFWPFNTLDTTKCTGTVGGKSYCQFSDINGVALGNSSWFGNYNLVSGTTMFARPFGAAYGGSKDASGSYEVGYGIKGNTTTPGETTGGGQFYYAYGNSYNPHPGTSPTGPTATFYPDFGTGDKQSEDMMMGILGQKWNYLRAGDIVNLKVVHIPTGKTIFNKDVTVEG
jgi:archaeal type IV pilus assembly protein PilA